MYRRILVAVENSAADRTILGHVTALARLTGAKLLLVHVADGWAARHFDELKLRESEEMREDRAYLDSLQAELAAAGIEADTHLAMGDPATELVKVAGEESVDLIAMSTHGHQYLADLLHGTTADRVAPRERAGPPAAREIAGGRAGWQVGGMAVGREGQHRATASRGETPPLGCPGCRAAIALGRSSFRSAGGMSARADTGPP